ncbi:MAG: histidine kinase [Porticoccaceae bacterium]|nr:type IV pili methyl-accepting chemotaxis transducer N-terminal domain-containing protein [Pseudomonadales bacterium]MCP5173229.1 type IV pili methyl-accepting chemotaxis transducer N-terminal domain-containing protein [Pseudomonadales bacterium]
MEYTFPFSIRPRLSRSITLQVALPMVLIGVLALSSMLVTIMVTLYSEHDAEAINVAGSMRMQSYRIAALMADPIVFNEDNDVLAVELEKEYLQLSDKLYQSSITEVVKRADKPLLNNAFQQVKGRWEEDISPLLKSVISHPGDRIALSTAYRLEVDSYVGDINQLVLEIQRNAEAKNELLGVYEGLGVFLFFMVMIFIIMNVDQRLVKPLKELVTSARRVSMGDFSQRASYEGQDEIGLLCKVFNDMTVNLEGYYRSLESLVDEKTEHLQRSNRVLDCLYRTAQHLSKLPIEQGRFIDIVTDLQKTTGIENISLCLSNEANQEKYDLILPREISEPCSINDCVNCHRRGASQVKVADEKELSFPISEQDNNFGFLYLKTAPEFVVEPWQRRLLEAVAENVSSALALQYSEGQIRRLILFEERSIIARELHDSLAQSLSYMKMQVARLSKMFQRKVSDESLQEGLDDLQTGLTAAYKHLRELLNTFRLQLSTPTLLAALEATVAEFGKHHDNIRLFYELGHCPFTPNEDIHILQIVREALSNAVKHADASEIQVRCFQKASGEVVFEVADNGVGLSETPQKEHHYGILTMRERAELLAGQVLLEARGDSGTTMSLAFKPQLISDEKRDVVV